MSKFEFYDRYVPSSVVAGDPAGITIQTISPDMHLGGNEVYYGAKGMNMNFIGNSDLMNRDWIRAALEANGVEIGLETYGTFNRRVFAPDALEKAIGHTYPDLDHPVHRHPDTGRLVGTHEQHGRIVDSLKAIGPRHCVLEAVSKNRGSIVGFVQSSLNDPGVFSRLTRQRHLSLHNGAVVAPDRVERAERTGIQLEHAALQYAGHCGIAVPTRIHFIDQGEERRVELYRSMGFKEVGSPEDRSRVAYLGPDIELRLITMQGPAPIEVSSRFEMTFPGLPSIDDWQNLPKAA